VKEYLATLDDTAWGAASDVVPKFVSPSDPAAQWTGAHKGPAFFAYSDNYLIDVKFGVIVDVEASRSIRQAEVGAAKTMIERTEERFGLKPERLGAGKMTGQQSLRQRFCLDQNYPAPTNIDTPKSGSITYCNSGRSFRNVEIIGSCHASWVSSVARERSSRMGAVALDLRSRRMR
jgi:hypothetical protein